LIYDVNINKKPETKKSQAVYYFPPPNFASLCLRKASPIGLISYSQSALNFPCFVFMTLSLTAVLCAGIIR
jgi:hypothetical protein